MNTTVIIIMIICATVIALVAIICNHRLERKMAEANVNSTLSKKIIRLHRNYIAGILGFAIIMLITANYGSPNNALFEYISFGSTITSFVLSVLAIFVTVQSSSDLYKQFTRIDNATDIVQKVSKQIDGTLGALENTKSNLTETSKQISLKLENIVEQIDEKIKTRIKETEVSIAERFTESLNSIAYDRNQKSLEEGVSVKHQSENDDKQYFLNITSATGLLGLYACALSSEKQKAFEISQLFKGFEYYSFGFLIAALSAKYVNFTNDEKNNLITCYSIQFTKEELYGVIKQRIEQLSVGVEYLNQVNIINDYFGETSLVMKIE